LDADHGWMRRNMITSSDIRDLLSEDFVLTPDPRDRNGAPAERFQVQHRSRETGGPVGTVLGTVGIIASVTEPFCADCRRTRITADGKVMSCLFSRDGLDLLGRLCSGDDDDELTRRWQDPFWST